MKTFRVTTVFYLAILLFAVFPLYAQYRLVDSLALEIPRPVTFSTDSLALYLRTKFQDDEKIVRALYIWMTNNISYDAARLDNPPAYRSVTELMDQTLKSRTGICQNYAITFTGIILKTGIPAAAIPGYTRTDGIIDTKTGHVWNAAKIGGKWYLFDLTWDAGFIRDRKFQRFSNTAYFMANPDSLIKTHMPFDPVWQFSDHPVKHDGFFRGLTRGEEAMNYTDSIEKYILLTDLGKAEVSMERSDKFNFTIPELSVLRSKQTENLKNLRLAKSYDDFNVAVLKFNQAVIDFNDYVMKSNNKNMPAETKRKSLNAISTGMKNCRLILAGINYSNSDLTSQIRDIKQKIGKLEKEIEKQKQK